MVTSELREKRVQIGNWAYIPITDSLDIESRSGLSSEYQDHPVSSQNVDLESRQHYYV